MAAVPSVQIKDVPDETHAVSGSVPPPRTSHCRSISGRGLLRRLVSRPLMRFSIERRAVPGMGAARRKPPRLCGQSVLVVDASVLASALADDATDGDTARKRLRGESLAAPT